MRLLQRSGGGDMRASCSVRPARRVHKRASSNTPTLRCVIGVQRAGATEHQCLGVLHTRAAQGTAWGRRRGGGTGLLATAPPPTMAGIMPPPTLSSALTVTSPRGPVTTAIRADCWAVRVSGVDTLPAPSSVAVRIKVSTVPPLTDGTGPCGARRGAGEGQQFVGAVCNAKQGVLEGGRRLQAASYAPSLAPGPPLCSFVTTSRPSP